MSSNAQKINAGVTDSQSANRQARDHVHNVPKELPTSIVKIDKTNSIMTLKFEMANTPWTLPNITVPLSGPEYIRYPMKEASGQQPGDLGFVTAGAANIGNISGLGPNTPANFSLPTNLSPLVFTPIGNKNRTPTDDQ